MRAIGLMLMLLGMSGTARADWLFTIDPPQVENGAVVNLRVEDTDDQCFPASGPVLVRDGNTIKARFDIEDFVPEGTPPGTCPPYRVTPRNDSLGTFATGNYVVEVTICSNPPGGPPCTLQATLELSVFGSDGQRFIVPTSSWLSLILLAMMLGVAAAIARSR